jgi:tetratricopeptide (TPR) repeat protein
MTHIFISHASADDDFVAELRRKLELCGLSVWIDSLNLRGGDKLDQEIRHAIADAEHYLVVLSPRTVNSPWVRREIALALAAQDAWESYRVIPLLLPGIEAGALALWFDEEPLGLKIGVDPGDLDAALPQILAALGHELPVDFEPPAEIAATPADELILQLRDPHIVDLNGAQRARAGATLLFQPVDAAVRAIESRRYTVTAPLGPIELDEIRWYLEEYSRWPTGVFRQRAERIRQSLAAWGEALFNAALGANAARDALTAWQGGKAAARRFSLWVDRDLPEGATQDESDAAQRAATELLALPWELIHDGQGFLLGGGRPVHVRRRLPNRHPQPVTPAQIPIRILLLSPRPDFVEIETPTGVERRAVGYFDHRSSALPLVEAVENLGDLVTLTVLPRPTLPALQAELQRARSMGRPYHVVHFDGHGVYDRRAGLGALLFEADRDQDRLDQRRADLVHADRVAATMRDYGIPLVFLDACQTSQAEEDLNSVATRLLEQGVSSVVAMSYTVLVESARRFVQEFYRGLAEGGSVGAAMLGGQRHLAAESFRLKIMGAGELHLADWFVPVLYQDEADPHLFNRLPPARVREMQAQQQRLRLGALPAAPPQRFVGRSRELLHLERLLAQERYAVVRGTGGAGKTKLAVEAARWLVRSGRFRRAAFVSVEQWQNAHAVLDDLGRQLLPGADGESRYSVAQYASLDAALQPVERALRDDPTLIVVDNLESILAGGEFNAEAQRGRDAEKRAETPHSASLPAAAGEILDLCRRLLDADGRCRIVFTSREGLPAPFERGRCRVELGRLAAADAVQLVERVMAEEGWQPAADDRDALPGATPQEVLRLVNAVDGHARALVLLAREVARRGVTATTARLTKLMADLDRRHPGDRENSLYASVELSLQRLPAAVRERVDALAVFHGGGHVVNLGNVMDVDTDAARQIAIALIDVGLAEDMGYGYLRLDPALPAYLARTQTAETLAARRARWAEAMMALVDFLYEQRSQDARLSARLTLLELPNLTALLDWLAAHLHAGALTPERVANVAGSIEQLLEFLGQPAALARAVAVRTAAAQQLGDWSGAQFEAERLRVERLLGTGQGQAALHAAEALHRRALAAGEDAYAGAAYDIAVAHILLGRVLHLGGRAADALTPLAEAQARFQALADGGDTSAALMASGSIVEQGDCLKALGRLAEAAACYEEGIRRAEVLDDRRGIAVNIGQLGTVRLYQGRHAEALTAWEEVRRIFQELGEPAAVAGAWHQMGVAHRQAGNWAEAERAYRQGLSIRVQHNLRGDQAASLGELGSLYDGIGRLEEAVTFYRQAADLYVTLGDLALEGRVRSNMADTLRQLGRLDEAWQAIERAIECKRPFGHAAEPWKTFAILHEIERAAGNPAAARAAWQQARAAYLAYRRDGGYAQGGGQFVADVVQWVQQGQSAEAAHLIAQVESADAAPQSLRKLATGVRLALGGQGDPSLADDPGLYYRDAAELLLFLERLGALRP